VTDSVQVVNSAFCSEGRWTTIQLHERSGPAYKDYKFAHNCEILKLLTVLIEIQHGLEW